MFGVGFPELVVLVLVLLVLTGLLVRVAARPAGPRVESRRVLTTRATGVALGVLAAWWTAEQGSVGTGAMLAPAVFGSCVLAAMAVGETLVRPPREIGPRTASLRPRLARDYLPRWLPALVGAQVVAVAGLLTLTTATAGRDPSTGSARVLTCSNPTVSQSSGAYPGAYYSVPLALALVLVLAAAALGCRLVLQRPRGNGPAGADDALRRRSLGIVVAAAGVALAATYVGLATTAGSALGNLGTGEPTCAAAWMRPVGIVVGLSALPALALALACLVVVLGRGSVATAPRIAAGR